jgi:hypothetical protein
VEVDATIWHFIFITPSEGKINITASTDAISGAGEGYLGLEEQPSGTMLDEMRGTDVGLGVSGSINITAEWDSVWVDASFFTDGVIPVLYFYAKPTITKLDVNSTTIAPGDAVTISGECRTKDYANIVMLNYTYEGTLYETRAAQYEYGRYYETGSFFDTFVPPADSPGTWTVVADLHVSSYALEGTGISESQMLDTKSASFTVTSGAQPSAPPPSGTSAQPPTSGISPFIILAIVIGVAVATAIAAVLIWQTQRGHIGQDTSKPLPPPPPPQSP